MVYNLIDRNGEEKMEKNKCLDELQARLEKEGISYKRVDDVGYIHSIHQIIANGVSCTCQPFGHGYPNLLELWDFDKKHSTMDCLTVDEAMDFIKGKRKFTAEGNGREYKTNSTPEEKEITKRVEELFGKDSKEKEIKLTEEMEKGEFDEKQEIVMMFKKGPVEIIAVSGKDFEKIEKLMKNPPKPNTRLRNLMRPRYILAKDGRIYDRNKDIVTYQGNMTFVDVGYRHSIEVVEEADRISRLIKPGNLVKGEIGFETPVNELEPYDGRRCVCPDAVRVVPGSEQVKLNNLKAIYALIGDDYKLIWTYDRGVIH